MDLLLPVDLPREGLPGPPLASGEAAPEAPALPPLGDTGVAPLAPAPALAPLGDTAAAALAFAFPGAGDADLVLRFLRAALRASRSNSFRSRRSSSWSVVQGREGAQSDEGKAGSNNTAVLVPRGPLLRHCDFSQRNLHV